MKYSKMLCWTDQDEQKAIKLANETYNIPVVFAKNYDDFISKIDDTAFLVVSAKEAHSNPDKLRALLLKTFNKNKIHILLNKTTGEVTGDIAWVFTYAETLYNGYTVSHIFHEYFQPENG